MIQLKEENIIKAIEKEYNYRLETIELIYEFVANEPKNVEKLALREKDKFSTYIFAIYNIGAIDTETYEKYFNLLSEKEEKLYNQYKKDYEEIMSQY